ncbi:hypothetical protein VARIO8X_120015 [Burkholderiales bacterium 8X]|nr:hypothetical protein VARIO8X_120015 [Burkholderiales bacterium 8X]
MPAHAYAVSHIAPLREASRFGRHVAARGRLLSKRHEGSGIPPTSARRPHARRWLRDHAQAERGFNVNRRTDARQGATHASGLDLSRRLRGRSPERRSHHHRCRDLRHRLRRPGPARAARQRPAQPEPDAHPQLR